MTATTNLPTTGATTPPPAPPTKPIRKLGRARTPLGRFYSTAVGKKWVMALTGIAIMLFLVEHLIGNLTLFFGKGEFNAYGEALRDLGGDLFPRTLLLWGFRIGLIVAFAFHIHAAYGLTRINMKARPDKYQSKRDYVAADFASRTMRWTGIILALYIIFHLTDLTWGAANPEFVRGDAYNNMIYSLQRPVVAIAYSVAMLALGFHLYHGAWSLFQSMGLNNPSWNKARRVFAIAFAGIMTAGFLTFPIAIQTHAVSTKCPHTLPVTAACKGS